MEATRGPSPLTHIQPGWRLVLASSSPRRAEMLSMIGLKPDIHSARVDETVQPGEPIELATLRIAQAKAKAVADMLPAPLVAGIRNTAVLGADTLVSVEIDTSGELVLGKPKDAADAMSMLGFLSGHTHRVVTAYAIMHIGQDRLSGARQVKLASSGLASTEVTFRPLDVVALNAYIATGEPMDKAGAYAIQGIGGSFIEKIEGSVSNVVGLPLDSVITDLLDLGTVGWGARD